LGNLELREEVIIMTVSDLILSLIKMQPEMPVVFYFLENNNLIEQDLETIRESDGRCEITIGEVEDV
jgi:hypothetical protein